MLSVLLALEITIMMMAGSIVAWLRYPYRHTDDYHIGCMRYIGPPVAVLLFFVTIAFFVAWMAGKPVGSPPLPIAVVFFAAMMIFYLIWAIREIRRPRPARAARTPRSARRVHDPRIVSARRPRHASVTRRSNSHN